MVGGFVGEGFEIGIKEDVFELAGLRVEPDVERERGGCAGGRGEETFEETFELE